MTDYLDRAGLTPYLDKLGFSLVGYGCTTCIGNSGPLPEDVASGRRRGRPERRRRPVGQPELRGADPSAGAGELPGLAAALRRVRVGRARRDRPDDRAARARAPTGPCTSRDIWPSPEEVAEAIRTSTRAAGSSSTEYGRIWDGDEHWASLPSPTGPMYDWDPASTYVQEPPFFDGSRRRRRRREHRGRARPREGRRLDHHRPHLAGRVDQGGLTRGGVPQGARRRRRRSSTATERAAATTR